MTSKGQKWANGIFVVMSNSDFPLKHGIIGETLLGDKRDDHDDD